MNKREAVTVRLRNGEELYKIVEAATEEIVATKEALVRLAIQQFKVESPLDLQFVEQHTMEGAKWWIEPMTPKVVDTRVAALNEENVLLRKQVEELQAALDAEQWARYEDR